MLCYFIMALLDSPSGYLLPTFRCLPGGLVCACDMCYDPVAHMPISGIGPHDLHCLCDDCMFFALDDEAYSQALSVRYPIIVENPPFEVTNLSPEEILYLNNSYGYHTPPNSPTNQEMHAYNGNESSWGDFIVAGIRGAAGSQNPADKFAAGALASAGLLGSSMLYTSYQDMATPLAELRDQFFPSPSNKDMHSYNGNIDVFGDFSHLTEYGPHYNKKTNKIDEFEDFDVSHLLAPEFNHAGKSIQDELAEINSKTARRLRGKIPKINDISKPLQGPISQDISKPLRGPIRDKIISNEITHRLVSKFPEIIEDPKFKQIQDQLNKPVPDLNQIKKDLNKLADNHPQIRTLGPTNKEMHAINGNIQGPANKGVSSKENKKSLRKLARKLNKTKKNVNVKKFFKTTIRKTKLPRGVRRAGKIETAERRLASKYSSFLKNPVFRPPRLGSTGSNPTKLLHGYYEITFNMAATGLTNNLAATDLIVFISPKMFKFFSSPSSFSGPVNIGTAINSNSTFTNIAATSSIDCFDFTNVTPLKNETGCTSSSTQNPLARFVGGHVSLRCRCPISTTAPPFMYGGLLPSQEITIGAGNTNADPSTQLNQLTSTQIRGLPSTAEITGMEGSVVYVPGSANDLVFNPFALTYNAANLPHSTIPYIGMTGCNTAANFTIVFSGWWEIMQTKDNAAYGGWSLGPKLSTEDIFDNLKRIKPVNSYALNQGAKSNAGKISIAQMIAPPIKKPEEEFDQLKIQLKELNEKFRNLTVDLDSEDEKYLSVSSPVSPKYQSLSRSTIDLALQLKDKLTPGSVTSKTSRTNFP
jgi:hypothetical protein